MWIPNVYHNAKPETFCVHCGVVKFFFPSLGHFIYLFFIHFSRQKSSENSQQSDVELNI